MLKFFGYLTDVKEISPNMLIFIYFHIQEEAINFAQILQKVTNANKTETLAMPVAVAPEVGTVY